MFFPAEWHQQAFVQLTWPHKDTDWAPVLADAISCFCEITKQILKYEPVLIVAQYPEEAEEELTQRGISLEHITFVPCPTNDTWARDHAFITCIDEQNRKVFLNDFQFNGWGLKFASNHDNQINKAAFPAISSIYQRHHIKTEYASQLDFVFEGGSIESDGEGTLMVTSSCLLADNRNNTLSQQDIEERLKQYFNTERVLWIAHSWLAGDDTDGHIDTIARFCSPTSIAYVKCDSPADEHYKELQAMEQELLALRTKEDKPYTLFPLPLSDRKRYRTVRIPLLQIGYDTAHILIRKCHILATLHDKCTKSQLIPRLCALKYLLVTKSVAVTLFIRRTDSAVETIPAAIICKFDQPTNVYILAVIFFPYLAGIFIKELFIFLRHEEQQLFIFIP